GINPQLILPPVVAQSDQQSFPAGAIAFSGSAENVPTVLIDVVVQRLPDQPDGAVGLSVLMGNLGCVRVCGGLGECGGCVGVGWVWVAVEVVWFVCGVLLCWVLFVVCVFGVFFGVLVVLRFWFVCCGGFVVCLVC
ncbi:hypothetical protein RA272_27715, partial [Pseudomonas syringae pv. tagetis]